MALGLARRGGAGWSTSAWRSGRSRRCRSGRGPTEAVLEGARPTPEVADRAAETLAGELKPIDDVRSTADYRRDRLGADPAPPAARRRRLVTGRTPGDTQPVGPDAPDVPDARMGDFDELDELDAEAFAAAVAPLFEGAPRFLARLAAARPFGTWATLFERARAIAHAMPERDQLELVDAHPRLGAPSGSVSAMSFREQGYDRERAVFAAAAGARPASSDGEPASERAQTARTVSLTDLPELFGDDPPLAPDDAPGQGTEDAIELERRRVAAKLDYLNARYEERFGFRYCVFVAGRPRARLIPEMAAALGRDRRSELTRALDAVVDIAQDRRGSTAGRGP